MRLQRSKCSRKTVSLTSRPTKISSRCSAVTRQNLRLRYAHDLSQQQLRGAVLNTAFLPKAEAEQYQALRNQQREVEVFTLKLADFQSQAQVTDEQIAQYYEQNKASFMTEEKVSVGLSGTQA